MSMAQKPCPFEPPWRKWGIPNHQPHVQVGNSTAEGFADETIKQKRSKVSDMNFCWIQDRTCQGQLLIYWRPGVDNLANYLTKHHSATHYRLMQPNFLHATDCLAHNAIHLLLRGCVKSRDSLPRRCSQPIAYSSHTLPGDSPSPTMVSLKQYQGP